MFLGQKRKNITHNGYNCRYIIASYGLTNSIIELLLLKLIKLKQQNNVLAF